LVRGVAPPLAVKVHGRIAGIVRRGGRHVAALETLQAGPGLNQRAVDGEVLVGQQMTGARLRQHGVEEGVSDFAVACSSRPAPARTPPPR